METHGYEVQVTISLWLNVSAISREEAERLVKEKTDLINYGMSKKVTIHGIKQIPDHN